MDGSNKRNLEDDHDAITMKKARQLDLSPKGSSSSPPPETVKEPEFFTTSMYTDEFNTMLETVLENESFLFNEQELDVFETFKSLQDESKHLIVRLIMRKPQWLRKSRIDYSSHVRDLDRSAADLESQGFLLTNITDFSEAIDILSKDELKCIARERNIQMPSDNSKKSDFQQEILKFASTSSIVAESTKAKTEKLWASINMHLGSCIKVNPSYRKPFEKLQIVYYRVNFLDNTNPISSSILAKTSKRIYPEYTVCRSSGIWTSREDYSKYEQALKAEQEFHNLEENLKAFNNTKTYRIPAEGGDPRIREKMIEAWTVCENYISIWEECIAEAQERPYYLRRFEAGWIYTRLIDHGTELLGKMHEYELEVLILKKLLNQEIYRIGKRGKWYDRMALVQTTHIKSDPPRLQKKIALQTCIDAIHDPRVHQIYLLDIHKRIMRLEKDLCVPRREQHDFGYMNLKPPKEITIYGERISEEIVGKKSIWRSDNGAECSVEQVALEYYQKKGLKGLHCENGYINALDGKMVLLFWDIIFASIPGVFETPYQSEPLDLRTDAFYESRIDLINTRLREIESGQYLNIIKQVDDRERPKNTTSIGINWNYEQQSIMEIAECIGPSALAALSKLFFEQFGQRQGGIPDLCCWNYEKKQCLFSEVKGPRDKLSKTQQIWLEALSGFGLQAEVCHVQVWKGEDVFL
ncbi:hypothetical protein [Parasitella parasitica]|uniref:Fanconi-associated nuclease n=1 Tax=Parasitella parasitica TaxID=35722 RepID=A0A0B7N784_9FUNG|nr:hypothetical protein [Parasitella parasitica]